MKKKEWFCGLSCGNAQSVLEKLNEVKNPNPVERLKRFKCFEVGWTQVPRPEDISDNLSPKVLMSFMEARIAFDRYISFLIDEVYSDEGIKEWMPGAFYSNRNCAKIRYPTDLPMVKEINPNHIEKNRRKKTRRLDDQGNVAV